MFLNSSSRSPFRIASRVLITALLIFVIAPVFLGGIEVSSQQNVPEPCADPVKAGLMLKQTMAAERIAQGASGELGQWTNTSHECATDAVQTIVNNALGAEKEVSFFIVNDGECDVIIGTAPQRGDFSNGRQAFVPSGSKERVHVTIPAGQYLMASCLGVENAICSWRISDLQS